MGPRSRTGCETCRQRKVKCSEDRPVCAQCAKSGRQCVPSQGITFRHQQNPSLNGVGNGAAESLQRFYGYRETFGKGATWVRVPQELTFVHTNNPYEDAHEGGAGNNGGHEVSLEDHGFNGADRGGDDYLPMSVAYPAAYATAGLEALSAVASQDQYSYAPPPAPMSRHGRQSSTADLHRQSPLPNGQTTSSQNLDFILNPASAPSPAAQSSNIDPRLQSEASASTASPPRQSSFHHRDPNHNTASLDSSTHDETVKRMLENELRSGI